MRTECLKYNRWRLPQQANSEGEAVNSHQRYELIRPILKGGKKPKQVSEDESVPLVSIYRYLKRFRASGGDIESLTDKSHAILSHPKWLTCEDKDKVVQYKLQHPHLRSRKIAKALANEGILDIHYRTVVNVLKERALTAPFFPTNHTN